MMLAITIRNETDWRGDDLRRIFLVGLRSAGASGEREIQVRHHRAKSAQAFVWTRGRGQYGTVWGDEYLEGIGIKMWVPHPGFIATLIDGEAMVLKSIAQVFEHEVYHTLGMRHREMANDLRHCIQPVPWSTGLRLRRKIDRSRAAAGSTGR